MATPSIMRERQGLRFLMHDDLHTEADQFWSVLGDKLDSVGTDADAQRQLLRSISTCIAAASVGDESKAEKGASTDAEDAGTDLEVKQLVPAAAVVHVAASPSTSRPCSPSTKRSSPAPSTKDSQEKADAKAKSSRSLVALSRRKKTPEKSMRTITTEEVELTAFQKSWLGQMISKYWPPPVIMPDSPQRLCWDVYMMFLILYYAIAVPVRVGFQIDPPNAALENFFSLCFGFDIILNFNTALKAKAEVFRDRWIIAKDYFKMWFWIDLVASFPFEMVLPANESVSELSPLNNATLTSTSAGGASGANKLGRLGKILRLLRIFKLLRLLKLGRIMKRMKALTEGNPNVMMLGRTFVTMGAILHWTACCYWFVVMQEGEEVRQLHGDGWNQWHPPDHVVDADDFELQYAYAFFWGISVTMGAGWDVIPGTRIEVGFSSVMITVGALLYITLLGSVTTIVANLNAEKTKQNAQLEAVLSHLKRRMVSKSVFRKVRDYYEFMWEDSGSGISASKTNKHLDELPHSLQVQLATEMHKTLLAQIPVFSSLDPEPAFFLVKCWMREIYVPNDVIVRAIGEDEKLYVVIRGKVSLYIPRNTDTYYAPQARSNSTTSISKKETDKQFLEQAIFMADMNPGNFFGESALFGSEVTVKKKRQAAVAINYSELLYITKEKFQILVDTFSLENTVDDIKSIYKSRTAKLRWRVAIILVKTIVRLNRMSKLPKKTPQQQSRPSFFNPRATFRRNSSISRKVYHVAPDAIKEDDEEEEAER